MIDAQQIKKDFPLFDRNPELSYLDTTATSLKPQTVIDAISDYYTTYSANIHRGIYDLSEQATAEFESSRTTVAKWIGAESADEVIFTRNTTEAINIVTDRLIAPQLTDTTGTKSIVSTIMEHHANFVPWQQLAKNMHAQFQVMSLRDQTYLEIVDTDKITVRTDILQQYITKDTLVFAFSAVSNVLGTVQPVSAIVNAVKELNPNTFVIVDAAQAVPHMKCNVQEWGADAIAFSAHKMLGPTGIGVLWTRKHHLDSMKPYQFGGDMISKVTVEDSFFQDAPAKFEAGTPHIAGVIGLKAAITYLFGHDLNEIHNYEQHLAEQAYQALSQTHGSKIQFIGNPEDTNRCGILSFTLTGVHPHDAAQILNSHNVAVRAGHHCAMPLHQDLGLSATIRASFYLYNTHDDIDRLNNAIGDVFQTFS